MHEFLILGAGVIGLSLASELARRGRGVLLIDSQDFGRGASWAAAGMLPPSAPRPGYDPVESLRGLSQAIYPQWSASLQEETGIDIGYRRCGALYLARQLAETASLRALVAQLEHDGIEVEEIEVARLRELEPELCRTDSPGLTAAYLLPGESQIRSPRLLQALIAACRLRGVQMLSRVKVNSLQAVSGRIVAVQTDEGDFPAGQVCVTAGAWTPELLAPLGWSLPMEPWRGQMVLWKTETPLLSHIVYEGLRYLVPRPDGHLLAGSTMERAGFASHTTEAAIEELKKFSRGLLPALRDLAIVKTWAGLRPGTADGLPFIGRLPGFDNLLVATGHFRSGVHLAPATAVLASDLLLGETPRVDLAPFRINR